MNFTKPMLFGSTLATLALAIACAHTAPAELVEARTIYARAAEGPSKRYTPADLHIARESLTTAERSFEADGDTVVVRDQAYIARRKAELAEVKARTEMLNQGIAVADRQEELIEDKNAARTKSELAKTRGALAVQAAAGAANKAASEKELAAERRRSAEAEARAAKAQADLAKLASVKQDDRGTIITLSGSVLFASNKFALLPAAEVRLGQVAEALLAGDPNSTFTVEGHTDSQGKAGANQELSVNRSNSVRNNLIAQGIAADRITSQGFGADRSIADNKTAEGRANNRRVEIVVKPGSAR